MLAGALLKKGEIDPAFRAARPNLRVERLEQAYAWNGCLVALSAVAQFLDLDLLIFRVRWINRTGDALYLDVGQYALWADRTRIPVIARYQAGAGTGRPSGAGPDRLSRRARVSPEPARSLAARPAAGCGGTRAPGDSGRKSMSLLWRERPDGRRAPGYLVYLAGGLASLAAVVFLHGRSGPAPRTAPRRPARSRSRRRRDRGTGPDGAGPGRGAVGGPSPSYRLDAPRAPAPAGEGTGPAAGRGSFDAIAAALANPPAGEPGPGSCAASSRLSPAESATPDRNPPDGRADRSGLLGYRDGAADLGSPAPPEAPPAPDGDVAARGTLIAVYVLTTVDTSNPAAVIQFGTARSLVYRRRCEIPFGTRFLGGLKGRPMRDRLNLAADTLLFPDGQELAVNASAVEADERGAHIRPGVAADYVSPPGWVRAAPYVSEAFSGFMGLLESRAQAPYIAAAGGAGLVAMPSPTPTAPLYQASGQAIQVPAARLREWEERYAPHFLIPAGTACWLTGIRPRPGSAASLDLFPCFPPRPRLTLVSHSLRADPAVSRRGGRVLLRARLRRSAARSSGRRGGGRCARAPGPPVPPALGSPPEPIYRSPKIGVVQLGAHLDAEGRLLGPQVMYQVVDPGGWDIDALDGGKGFIPAANREVPPDALLVDPEQAGRITIPPAS